MATIRVCDWTKKVLSKDDSVTEIIFRTEVGTTQGEKAFEVGLEGMTMLLKQLEGEDEPKVQVVEKIVHRDTPPSPLQAANPGGLDIEVKGDPFDAGPNSMPMPVQGGGAPPPSVATAAAQDDDDVPPLEIPDVHPTKRLKMPTPAQGDKVLRESTRFEEGTLSALSRGAAAHKQARERLKVIEAQKANDAKRSGGRDVNVNPEPSTIPGRFTED